MPSPSRPSRTSRRRGPAGSRPNARTTQPARPRDRSPNADAVAATAEGRIAVGRINSTWGLRGHVKVTALSSNPQRFEPGAVLFVRGEPRRILEVVYPRGYPCIVFEGYEHANAADVAARHADRDRRGGAARAAGGRVLRPRPRRPHCRRRGRGRPRQARRGAAHRRERRLPRTPRGRARPADPRHPRGDPR